MQIRQADNILDVALKFKNTTQMEKEETMKKVHGLQGAMFRTFYLGSCTWGFVLLY